MFGEAKIKYIVRVCQVINTEGNMAIAKIVVIGE